MPTRRAKPKLASRKKWIEPGAHAFVSSTVTAERIRENRFSGDDTASAQSLYAYVDGDPLNQIDPTGEFGFIGAAAGAGWDLGWQILVEGKSLRCVDIGSVLTSAAIGAVTPGWLTVGRTANRTRKAVTALEDQLARAQTAARRAKIEQRIEKNVDRLNAEVGTQGILTGVKKLLQNEYETKPWTIGSDCECRK